MSLDKQKFAEITLTSGRSDLVYRSDDLEELLMTLMESTYKAAEIETYKEGKKAYLKSQLEKPETLVLFDGERMVGFVGLKMFESPNNLQDVYFEIKSLVVSKSYQGAGLAKNIAAQIEKVAVDKARLMGKGCFLFCSTSTPSVQYISLANGYRQVPARDWFAVTRPNEDTIKRNNEADEMEREYKMITYVKDSFSTAELQKVADAARATAVAVAPILDGLDS